ncbi:hypothetical protein C8R43DRAFT_947204 [Mycena crocata]|nr:hypothetical protein C8R43DRAFT_947204 [Mycena crocata]
MSTAQEDQLRVSAPESTATHQPADAGESIHSDESLPSLQSVRNSTDSDAEASQSDDASDDSSGLQPVHSGLLSGPDPELSPILKVLNRLIRIRTQDLASVHQWIDSVAPVDRCLSHWFPEVFDESGWTIEDIRFLMDGQGSHFDRQDASLPNFEVIGTVSAVSGGSIISPGGSLRPDHAFLEGRRLPPIVSGNTFLNQIVPLQAVIDLVMHTVVHSRTSKREVESRPRRPTDIRKPRAGHIDAGDIRQLLCASAVHHARKLLPLRLDSPVHSVAPLSFIQRNSMVLRLQRAAAALAYYLARVTSISGVSLLSITTMDVANPPQSNPVAANFLNNQPVTLSSDQALDFDLRCGHSVPYLAHISSVPESVVVAAIENDSHDRVDDDKHYIGEDFKQAFSASNIQLQSSIGIQPVMPTQLSAPVQPSTTTSRCRFGPPGQQSVHTVVVAAPENCINPSVEDFLRCIPGIPARHPGRKFDRVGRALARGVYGYPDYEDFTKISTAFGSTHGPVRSAVLNLYSSPDNIDDDPDHLPKGFLDAYPWRPEFRPTMSARSAKRLANSLEGKDVHSAKRQKTACSDMEEEVDLASDTEVDLLTPDVVSNVVVDGLASDAEVDQLASDTECDQDSVPEITSIQKVLLAQTHQTTSRNRGGQRANANVKLSDRIRTRRAPTPLCHHRYPTRSSNPSTVVACGAVSSTYSKTRSFLSAAVDVSNSSSVTGVALSRSTTTSSTVAAEHDYTSRPVVAPARSPICSRVVSEFLGNVDRFDLSAWANVFGKKGLGTLDALLNIGRLGEARLEELLKRILEDDPMPQAHMLLLIDKILALADVK